MSILCGNKAHETKTYHASVAEVKACYQNAGVSKDFAQGHAEMDASETLHRLRTQHARNDAARKRTTVAEVHPAYGQAAAPQISFLRSLAESRDPMSPTVQEAKIWFDAETGEANPGLSKSTASKLISELKVMAKYQPSTRDQAAKSSAPARVTEDGMYQDPDGQIYKVQWNRAQGSGRNLYAKKLVSESYESEPHKGDSVKHWNFAYVPNLIAKIRPEWKMTKEQAAEFGKLYGICVRCHRDLTDETSIALGIGPICAGKEGWV